MKYPKKCKPEKVVSTDKTRATLQQINVVKSSPLIDSPAMIATNGRAAIHIPVELDKNDEVGRIDPLVLKSGKIKDGKKNVEIKGTARNSFPDTTRIIPSNRAKVRVCINAEELYNWQLASGDEHVILDIFYPKEVIGLHSPRSNCVGAIMPCRTSTKVDGNAIPCEATTDIDYKREGVRA